MTVDQKKMSIPSLEAVCAFMRVATAEEVKIAGNSFKLRGTFTVADVIQCGPIKGRVIAIRENGDLIVRPMNDMKVPKSTPTATPTATKPVKVAREEPEDEGEDEGEDETPKIPPFIREGAIVRAKYEGEWLRGEILSVNEKKLTAKVYFPEDDSNASIGVADIRAIPPKKK